MFMSRPSPSIRAFGPRSAPDGCAGAGVPECAGLRCGLVPVDALLLGPPQQVLHPPLQRLPAGLGLGHHKMTFSTFWHRKTPRVGRRKARSRIETLHLLL